MVVVRGNFSSLYRRPGALMECPVCGSGLNHDLSGEAFCVVCECRSSNLYHGTLAPGMFEKWRHTWKVTAGWLIVGAVFYAALYELVKW